MDRNVNQLVGDPAFLANLRNFKCEFGTVNVNTGVVSSRGETRLFWLQRGDDGDACRRPLAIRAGFRRVMRWTPRRRQPSRYR
jgi:hypothetical protein